MKKKDDIFDFSEALNVTGNYKAPEEKKPVLENDSVTQKNQLLMELMNEFPQQKKVEWTDLLIPALSTAVGYATGYTGEGASAGMTGLKAVQEANKDDNEYDLAKHKYKVALASALDRQPDPKTDYLKIQKDDGRPGYAWAQGKNSGELDLTRGEDKKAASDKIGKYWMNGSLIEMPFSEYEGRRNKGEKIKPYTVPAMIFNPQTGAGRAVEKLPGATYEAPQTGGAGSAYTPSNYAPKKELTKSQLDELNKAKSNFISKTDPDRDALNKMKGVSDSIKLYRSQGNVMAGKQAVQQYLTSLEKGPIGPTDRDAIASSYGGWDKMKRYFEEKIEGDPQTAMAELEGVSNLLNKNIASRIESEQRINVEALKAQGVDEEYAASVFGYDPLVRVKNPQGQGGYVKKSKLQEKLKQGYSLEQTK